MKLSFLFVIFFTFSKIHAQNVFPVTSSGKNLGLSNISSPIDGIYSLFGNQAGLSTIKSTQFLLHGQNQFLLPELNLLGAGAAIPTNSGVFGLAIQHYGFDLYNEQKIGLVYSRELFKNFSVGVQFNFLNLNIREYGNKGIVTFELGMQYKVLKNFRIATHIFNPVNVGFTEEDVVPTYITLGIAYLPSDKLSLLAEIEKSNLHPATFKAGIDYRIMEILSLRLGVRSFPISNSFGIGLHIQKFTIDIGTNFHQVLGTTTGLSVIFALDK